MVCNDLVMPVLLRARGCGWPSAATWPGCCSASGAARSSRLLLGYLYFRLAGEAYALVSIGLISFAAVAQFAPAMLGGMYWPAARAAARSGACSPASSVWAYTLLLPSFARSGWLPRRSSTTARSASRCSRPTQLFGLTGLDQITHAMIWSMLANVGAVRRRCR